MNKGVPGFIFRKRNIYSSLETSSDGRIQSPWQVSSSQNKHTSVIMTNTLHLDQKFSLNSSWCFVFSIRSVTTHGVDLINEDDRRLFFTSQVKERFDQSFALTNILAHEIRRGHWEESSLSFSCTSFSKICFSCSWRTIKQNSFPRFSTSCENLFESNGQNDSFFECILGILKSCDIFPLDIGLFGDDGIIKLTFQVVVLFVVVISTVTSSSSTSSSSGLRHWIYLKLPYYFPSSLFLSLPLSSLSLFSY